MRVVIVGAGISGLSLAFRLQQRSDCDVVVLEAAARPGGTLWTVNRDGFRFETGPNGFLDTKPSTLHLCRELGLGERLVEASPAAGKNRYLFLDGRLQLLPGSLVGLVKTRLLSWRGKLDLIAERFRRGGTAEDESIDSFARRRAGDEVADILADAMVTGIFAGDPKQLSLPACFPRVAALERAYGSVMKGMAASAKQRRRDARVRGEVYRRPGTLWSLQGGLGELVATLRGHLRTAPILGVPVRRVERTGPHWSVVAGGQERWDADAVVLACPAPEQATMLADLDAELAGQIDGIPYCGVAVVGLGFRRQDVPGSLDGFGFIAPQRTRRDVLGVQWCSSIFPGRAPEGAVLMRAMCGGGQRGDMVGWDDARLLGAIRAELRLAMGIEAAPFFVDIARWPRAIPQYHVGHLARVARIDEQMRRHPGLFLGGNAYRGVAMNDCTEQGALLADSVAEYLRSRAS